MSSVGWVYSPTEFLEKNAVGEYTHPTELSDVRISA
jgi:hypothetical protein